MPDRHLRVVRSVFPPGCDAPGGVAGPRCDWPFSSTIVRIQDTNTG